LNGPVHRDRGGSRVGAAGRSERGEGLCEPDPGLAAAIPGRAWHARGADRVGGGHRGAPAEDHGDPITQRGGAASPDPKNATNEELLLVLLRVHRLAQTADIADRVQAAERGVAWPIVVVAFDRRHVVRSEDPLEADVAVEVAIGGVSRIPFGRAPHLARRLETG